MAGQPPGSSSHPHSRTSSRSRTGTLASPAFRMQSSGPEFAFLLDVSNYYVIFAIAIRALARQGLAKSPALVRIEPDSSANRGLMGITNNVSVDAGRGWQRLMAQSFGLLMPAAR
jgi:hypothetical protein